MITCYGMSPLSTVVLEAQLHTLDVLNLTAGGLLVYRSWSSRFGLIIMSNAITFYGKYRRFTFHIMMYIRLHLLIPDHEQVEMDENVAVDVRTGSIRSCPAWLLPSAVDLSVTNRNEFLPRVMGRLILCPVTFICLCVSDTERQPREQRTLKADYRSKGMSLIIVIWYDQEEDAEADTEDGAEEVAVWDTEENQEKEAELDAEDG